MRILAFYSYKGGTGKTTSAGNIGYNLSAEGKRVLLIDMDPQCNLTYLYGKVNRLGSNIYTLFKDGKSISSCIRRTRFPQIDMVYGSIKLDELDVGDPEILKRALQEVANNYDYVIIDCHPAFDWKTINSLAAANDLIVTFKPDQFGLNGLELVKNRVRKCRSIDINYNNLEKIRILVTMAANRKSQLTTLFKLFEDEPWQHFETAISYSEAVNSAMEMKKPLLKHRAKATATKDYCAVTKEYAGEDNNYEC